MITRYVATAQGHKPTTGGDWVRYEDHEQALAAERERADMGAKAAELCATKLAAAIERAERAEGKLAAMSEGDKERASRRSMALVNGALEIHELTARAEAAEAEVERLRLQLQLRAELQGARDAAKKMADRIVEALSILEKLVPLLPYQAVEGPTFGAGITKAIAALKGEP